MTMREEFNDLVLLVLAVATVALAICWEGDHQALVNCRHILAQVRAANPKMAIPEP